MKIGDLRCRPQQFLVEDSHCINPILVCSKLKWRNPEKYLITQRWETCCGKRKNIIKYFVLKIYKKFFNPDLTYLFQNMLLQCQSELVCTVTNIAFHFSWLRQPPSLPCRVCPTAVHQNHFSQDLWQKFFPASCLQSFVSYLCHKIRVSLWCCRTLGEDSQSWHTKDLDNLQTVKQSLKASVLKASFECNTWIFQTSFFVEHLIQTIPPVIIFLLIADSLSPTQWCVITLDQCQPVLNSLSQGICINFKIIWHLILLYKINKFVWFMKKYGDLLHLSGNILIPCVSKSQSKTHLTCELNVLF